MLTSKDNKPSLESYIPGRLWKPEYYLKLRGKLLAAGIPVDGIDFSKLSIGLNENSGFYDNSIFRIITLPDRNGYKIGKLITKIGHPRKRVRYGTLGYQEIDKRFNYEYTHLSAWNRWKLPSPGAIDLFSESLENGSDFYHTIIMRYIDNPTHDLDIILINKLIIDNKLHMRNPQSDDNERKSKESNIEELKKMRLGIIKSVLKTQIKTFLIGTYYLKSSIPPCPQDVHKFTPEEEIRSDIHYTKNNFIFCKTAGETFSSLFQNVDESTVAKDYAESFSDIVRFLLRDEIRRYVHGDEFLHHYTYGPKNGNSGGLVSIMFDANLAQLTNPISSFMKILTTPHLEDIIYKELVEENFDFIERYIDSQINWHKNNNKFKGIEALTIGNKESILLEADLTALRLIPKLMGLKETDEITLETREYLANQSTQSRSYSNNMITFPEKQPTLVSFEDYNTKKVLNAFRNRLNEVIERLESNSLPYRIPDDLKKGVKLAVKYCKKYKYI